MMDSKKTELVTLICKNAIEHGLTYKDMAEVFSKVIEFYHNNAKP